MEDALNINDLLNILDWQELIDIDSYDVPDDIKDAWADVIMDLKNYELTYREDKE
jgi:hypothetical protein